MLDDTRSVVSAQANMADDATVDDGLGIPPHIANIRYGRITFAELCERLANGEYQKDIARDAGIDPSTISSRVQRQPDQHAHYMHARRLGAERMVEDGMMMIDASESLSQISRARESFRARAWYAEKTDPERFGRREQVTVSAPAGPLLTVQIAQIAADAGASACAITRTGNMLNPVAYAQCLPNPAQACDGAAGEQAAAPATPGGESMR